MLLKLNHVAVAVPSLEASRALYHDVFKVPVSQPRTLPEHGIRLSFVTLQNTVLELMEPLNEVSPLANFLKRQRAGGIHHLCFEVEDMKASLKELQEAGLRVLGDGIPKTGAHGKPVIFLHPKDFSGVLIELEGR